MEVKTGQNVLSTDQINSYWDLARDEGVNHILTISNEIASSEGVHPTPGLKVRKSSPVGVSHLSWTAILTTAIRIKEHAGVSDPEQAWILGELVRYLEHRRSGALTFDDMGQHWVDIRNTARSGALTVSASLGALIDDRSAFDGDARKEAHRFRIVAHAEMGQGRKSGQRTPGFIDTVLELVNSFYGSVVQNVTPWQPPAPKLKPPSSEPAALGQEQAGPLIRPETDRQHQWMKDW